MDVALRVAELRDDDARRPQDRRGHAGRDPRERDRARPLPRQPLPRGGATDERALLLEVEGLDAFYGSAQALEGVSLRDGHRGRRRDRPQRHGQDDALQRDHGHRAAAARGLDPLRGHGAARQAVVQDRAGRDRLRPAGPAALPVALGRRAPADDPRGARAAGAGRPRPSTSSSRASPSGSGSARRSSPAASSRCSRSAARSSRTRSC